MNPFPLFRTLEDVQRQRQADKPLFSLGQVVATPAALELLERHSVTPFTLLHQHQHGDWGDLCATDKKSNDQALLDGSRLLSAYMVAIERLYIITEAVNEATGQRDSTCAMLTWEY